MLVYGGSLDQLNENFQYYLSDDTASENLGVVIRVLILSYFLILFLLYLIPFGLWLF